MSERQTVAVVDETNKAAWFDVAEARRWTATTLLGGALYRVAGRWVALDGLAELAGEPARIVDDEAAVTWFAVNGYSPPTELVECAQRRKLR
jgi:hypothetical protein